MVRVVKMDSKLERFLNAINFDKKYYECFSNAIVKDVLLTKKTNKMTLIIDIDKLLPIDVFKELMESSLTLKGADKVRFKFNVKSK